MIGDEIAGCTVGWREKAGMSHHPRKLNSVTVRHAATDTVEWVRPNTGAIVQRRLTGRHTTIVSPEGVDVMKLWMPVKAPPTKAKQLADAAARDRYAVYNSRPAEQENGYDETDTVHFHAMVKAGFHHEIESYGISDGMCRRAIDPAYAHEPGYLEGHRKGLALPEQQNDDDDDDFNNA